MAEHNQETEVFELIFKSDLPFYVEVDARSRDTALKMGEFLVNQKSLKIISAVAETNDGQRFDVGLVECWGNDDPSYDLIQTVKVVHSVESDIPCDDQIKECKVTLLSSNPYEDDEVIEYQVKDMPTIASRQYIKSMTKNERKEKLAEIADILKQFQDLSKEEKEQIRFDEFLRSKESEICESVVI